jgi:hypothetical protein
LNEFALMDGQTVVNIVTTNQAIEQVRQRQSNGYKVVYLDEVPKQALGRYRYWSERAASPNLERLMETEREGLGQ